MKRSTRCALAIMALVLTCATRAFADGPEDAYIKGYAAAVLERQLGIRGVPVRVTNGVITLPPLAVADAERSRVVEALSAVPGVVRVEFAEVEAPADARTAATKTPRIKVLEELQTGLLPGGHLFKPLIADPRWPHFGAGYQYYVNEPGLRDVGAVSFGESFSLYRDKIGGGWWETGIQAGVFALFDLDAPSQDLINADYLIAAFLGYRLERLSALFRLFHQSSHLGDEFLLRNRVSNRVNLSYESIDLKLSYDLPWGLRIYGGGGYLFDQEPSSLRPGSVQWGAEFVSPWPAADATFRPVAAVDVQNREENDWHTDVSVRAGLQFDGVLLTRNLQILLEYFRGHSPNGQFYKQKIDYFGIGAHFHF
jgi:Protein of unknown function (DUF1207)